MFRKRLVSIGMPADPWTVIAGPVRGVAVEGGAIPTRDATTTPNEMPMMSVRRISEYRIPMRMATSLKNVDPVAR